MKVVLNISICLIMISATVYADLKTDLEALKSQLNMLLLKLTTHVTFKFTTDKRGNPMLVIDLEDEQNKFLGNANIGYDISKKSAYLYGIAVPHQGKGYGKIIWDNMIGKLKELGIRKMNFSAVPSGTTDDPTWNERRTKLVDWYKRQGAKITKIESNAIFMEYEF